MKGEHEFPFEGEPLSEQQVRQVLSTARAERSAYIAEHLGHLIRTLREHLHLAPSAAPLRLRTH